MSWLSEKWYDRWPLNQPTNQPTKPLQQLSCLAHSQAPLEEQFLYYGLFYFIFLSTLACSCLTDINFLITNTSPSFDIYMTFCPAVCKFSSPEFWGDGNTFAQAILKLYIFLTSVNDSDTAISLVNMRRTYTTAFSEKCQSWWRPALFRF